MYVIVWIFCIIPIWANSEICEMGLDEGNCTNIQERFYYNSSWNHCQAFNYTGCGESLNNFLSLNQCQETCVSTQSLKEILIVSNDKEEEEYRVYELDLNNPTLWKIFNLRVIGSNEIDDEIIKITTPSSISTTPESSTIPNVNSTNIPNINSTTIRPTNSTASPNINSTISSNIKTTTERHSGSVNATIQHSRITNRRIRSLDDVNPCGIPSNIELDATIQRNFNNIKGKQLEINFTAILKGYDAEKSTNPLLTIDILSNDEVFNVFNSNNYGLYMDFSRNWTNFKLYVSEPNWSNITILITLRAVYQRIPSIANVFVNTLPLYDNEHYKDRMKTTTQSSTTTEAPSVGLSTAEITLIVFVVLLTLFGIFITYRHFSLLRKLGEFQISPSHKSDTQNYSNPVFSS